VFASKSINMIAARPPFRSREREGGLRNSECSLSVASIETASGLDRLNVRDGRVAGAAAHRRIDGNKTVSFFEHDFNGRNKSWVEWPHNSR
jgi:hypothetical protein